MKIKKLLYTKNLILLKIYFNTKQLIGGIRTNKRNHEHADIVMSRKVSWKAINRKKKTLLAKNQYQVKII